MWKNLKVIRTCDIQTIIWVNICRKKIHIILSLRYDDFFFNYLTFISENVGDFTQQKIKDVIVLLSSSLLFLFDHFARFGDSLGGRSQKAGLFLNCIPSGGDLGTSFVNNIYIYL